MPELPDVEELRERMRRLPVGSADWFRIEAKDGGKDKPKSAEIWIYDRIGASWFDEGTDAKSFAKKLAALDVEQIILHLNTPGGDAFDGIAIYNSLKDHKAEVNVVVDGLAASAGSFIAQAGDTVRMNRAAQMMIHDASGVVVGNAKDVADFADVLNKLSDSIAGIYAGRAGGGVGDWREVMSAETWYTAAEAVDAGLADEMVDVEPADPKARASFDLRVFNYAGRAQAPPPAHKPPAPPGPDRTGGTPVDITDEQLSGLRKKAGVADDADLDTTLAALPDPPAAPVAEPESEPQAVAASGPGTMVIDRSAWDEREERIKRLEASAAKQRREERDQVIADAVRDGKFAPARKAFWTAAWDKAPEETRALIDGLTKNVIPVMASGHAGGELDDEEFDAEFAHLFPPTVKGR